EVIEAAATEIEVAPDVRVIGLFYTAQGPIAADSLSTHCATYLARYKQPRMFRHVTALPRNANGKIQRKHLRTLT
ncbi:MAG: benzoate--CoA ligase, partial [Paracoccaceae bacterium]